MQHKPIGADARYLESMWHRWSAAPHSVSADWQNAFAFVEAFFGPFGDHQPSGQGLDPGRMAHLATTLEPFTQAPGEGDAPGWTMETGHLDDPRMVQWINMRLEAARAKPEPSAAILDALLRTEGFERFMATKFPAKKRFGSEGAEAILPLVEAVLDAAEAAGIEEVIVGTMHRARLTLMANAFGAGLEALFAALKGAHPFADHDEAADVPYHFGGIGHRKGLTVRVLPNPSHLEAVNAVAIGAVRAAHRAGRRTLAMVLHTDASVIAQGVNAELIQMAALDGFSVGGTIHVVINNRIGFTTEPHEARSARYCTSGWRAADSLIAHVNGADPDAAVAAARTAVAFRNMFARDAVIDLVCFRANGHNEIDEPRFTQPAYYRKADAMRPASHCYAARLAAHFPSVAEFVVRRRAEIGAGLAAAFADAALSPDRAARLPGVAPSGPDVARLRKLGLELSRIPAGAGAHPKMARLTASRAKALDDGIDWAFAEALAFARLLDEGVPVRLSGQDAVRGSFSHRHLAAVDPDGTKTCMLARFARDGASAEVVNSPLSEYAVLGFEYGQTLGAPCRLVVWEAQFGDFANGAQIMFDQFISSGWEKWRQRSNLAVLLPHGLEGQGPEHSSARPERLLQLCARDNMVIAQPSTPANYHHLLRAQPWADRPLIVLTPKMLLRLPEARSPLTEMAGATAFRPVIGETGPAARAVLCSGKIAYELARERGFAEGGVAIIRLEQLYPFPRQALLQALTDCSASEWVWLQEEPENFGAWGWLAPRLAEVASAAGLPAPRLIARRESASPAGSFHEHHGGDQRALLRRALDLARQA